MHHFVNKFAFLRHIDSFLRWVCSLTEFLHCLLPLLDIELCWGCVDMLLAMLHSCFCGLFLQVNYWNLKNGFDLDFLIKLMSFIFFDSNRLAAVMLKDPETAFRASVLFCFNPASIFYSSM